MKEDSRDPLNGMQQPRARKRLSSASVNHRSLPAKTTPLWPPNPGPDPVVGSDGVDPAAGRA